MFTSIDTATVAILLIEALTIVVAIAVTWGMTRVRLNNLEKSVNEIKKAIEEYEEHNINFREQTIGRVSYLEAKVNGRNKP